MYDAAALSMIADPQPTGTTRLCLSCHDGTIALDDVINPPLTHTGPSAPGETIKRCATDCHNGGNPAGGFNWENVWFDTRLEKQHPISITYDATRDAGFRPATAVEAAGLKLEDGKVQCTTCHDPHTQQNRKFLRIPNTGGSLCLVCHVTRPSPSTAHFW
jgi:predicted CXXCH cytochrome family protein